MTEKSAVWAYIPNLVFRFEEPPKFRKEKQWPSYCETVERIDRRGIQPDQDLVLCGRRSCYLCELQHVRWRPVLCGYNGLQRAIPPWTCEKCSIIAVVDEVFLSEGNTMNEGSRRKGRLPLPILGARLKTD